MDNKKLYLLSALCITQAHATDLTYQIPNLKNLTEQHLNVIEHVATKSILVQKDKDKVFLVNLNDKKPGQLTITLSGLNSGPMSSKSNLKENNLNIELAGATMYLEVKDNQLGFSLTQKVEQSKEKADKGVQYYLNNAALMKYQLPAHKVEQQPIHCALAKIEYDPVKGILEAIIPTGDNTISIPVILKKLPDDKC